MHLILKAQGVPQANIDTVVCGNELLPDDSPHLFDEPDDKDADQLASDGEGGVADTFKHKWGSSTLALEQHMDVLQTATVELRPNLFDRVARMRSCIKMLFILGQLMPSEHFAFIPKSDAVEAKPEPTKLMDDDRCLGGLLRALWSSTSGRRILR